jgi:hypothetical protein
LIAIPLTLLILLKLQIENFQNRFPIHVQLAWIPFKASNNESTDFSSGFEIPFMSKIPDFIPQKKKECLRLEKD